LGEESVWTLISIILFILLGLLGFVLTILTKRRLERGLGRKVGKLEANSISNWIKAVENEEKDRAA
jgi:hypothetical protein